MSSDSGPLGLLWPEIDDASSAKAVSRLGFWAAVWVCIWTTGVATYGVLKVDASVAPYGPLAYLDAAIFAVLAIGIWKLWRTAALVALVLFLLEQVFAALRTGSMVGLIMPAILTLFLTSGVRGTFAYHKFSRVLEAAPGTDD